MKRIIVEGPDGSGKSTLMEHLAINYGSRVAWIAGFKHQYEEPNYVKWLTYQMTREDNGLIPMHDRLFYSELVYQPIFRPEDMVIPGIFADSVKEILRREAFLIYCHVPYDQLVKYATNKEQMPGVMDNLRKIYQGYQNVMAEEAPHYMKLRHYAAYDFTRGDVEWNRLNNYLGLYLDGLL